MIELKISEEEVNLIIKAIDAYKPSGNEYKTAVTLGVNLGLALGIADHGKNRKRP